MVNSKSIRVGLIGYGLSGRYLQAPFYRAHPSFALTQVQTSRESEVHTDDSDARVVSDTEAMVSDPNVDLISIATPNPTHYELARAALEASKHVLVDKPACPTAAQLRELRDLAGRKNKHLFVYQNRRWDSDYLTLRRLLDAGSLGELVSYEARYDRWKPEPNAKAWKETPGPGAGMLYDLGAHLIDQAICLFGRPEEAIGRSWTQRGDSDISDAFDIQFVYGADRPHVRLSCSLLVREPTPRYLLHGRRGSFVKYGIDRQEDHLRAGMMPGSKGFGYEEEDQRGLLHTEIDGLTVRGPVDTLPGHWIDLYDNMARAIRGEAEPAVPLDDVIAQLEIIEAIEGGRRR